MSIPSTEARVAAQERLTLVLSARIEELAQDLKQDNKLLFEHMQKGFEQAHAFVEERFENVETRLDRIETTQAEQGQKLDQILQLLQQKSNE